MTWLSPIWLFLLVPWAAAWVWIGRSAGPTAGVPFLRLWPAAAAARGPRRRRPPAWLILLMAALLAMIVAAAGPAVWRAAPTLTVIVDRSPSLAGERLKSALARLPILATTRVRVIPIPGEAFEVVGPIDPGRLPATAVAAPGEIARAIRRESGPLVVVTDQSLDGPPGVGVVNPSRPLSNAGVDRFSITTLPAKPTSQPSAAAQAMVTVFNGTDRTRAMLRIDGVRQSIDLPPTGQSADYFIDLPVPGETSEARLLADDGKPWADDAAVDDRAYLARTASPARIEATAAVSDDLSRMIAVYQHRRPAGPDAPAVLIVNGDPPKGPAVILAAPLVPMTAAASELHASVDASHPITRSADFAGIDAAAHATVGPAGDGWRPLIRPNAEPMLNNVPPLLAVREVPSRQVWIGFDPGFLARRADYVIFWTDVFDWLGGGAAAYTAIPPRTGLTPIQLADAAVEGSPGVYRDGARTVAVAVPAIRPSPTAATGALPPEPVTLQADAIVTPPLTAALVLVTAALVLGRGSRLTRF